MIDIVNTTKPNNNVNNTNDPKKNPAILIDFIAYPKWTHSIRVGEYTNFLSNEKECSKQFYNLINNLLPYIQRQGKNIFSGPDKCHLIKDDKRVLAVKIIEKIHGIVISKETELWQLGNIGGTRLVSTLISGTKDEDSITVYPLFIDHNHLIYPSIKNNQKDYSKKGCGFCPQEKYS
ncbi:hypothetical protein CKN96_15720 [Carnobacterium maltaromaticum]|uniref:hypothetical protein n=1 Tax=Carnobacterium maltaromaticum TaxID=2751 RepID=UPI0010741112|nr:hypothetical protein [Carnobacterium maltaromaticum]TFJ56030.1 hypothetical protein CKN96_15720 [Carnobacterium maltaromaticum]